MVHTRKLVPDAPIVLAESQVAAYVAADPDMPYVVHPDSVVGISAKRQWCLDYFQDVFMLDDDVTYVRDMTLSPETPSRYGIMTSDRLISVIQRCHDTAAQLGIYVYGFMDMAKPYAYDDANPFQFTSFMHGNGLGIRAGSDLWFHPGIVTFDDLWLSALNISKHRIMLQDRRYALGLKDTGHAVGGNASRRTTQSYINDRVILEEAFGTDVIGEKPIPHGHGLHNEHQLTLRRPW